MLAALFFTLCLSTAGNPQVPADDDPFRVSEEMKQFLETHIDRSADALLKLQTLVRVVFEENALNFTYVAETRTAVDTFNKRGGNCVSFTFLFLAMAREVGLDARFREVDIVPLWSRIGNIVSMNGHANAAVYIGNQAYIVDLFPRIDRILLGGKVVSDERALAHYLNNKGVDCLAAGRQTEAMQYFHKALESDPTMASVWTNLGAAQSFAGQADEAVRTYRKALQVNPGELVAMSNLASLYERLGRDAEAKTYQSKVRKFNQKNPYYHYNLSLQDYQSGEYRDSLEHLKTALRLKPAEHNFYLALAKDYIQLGETNKATEALKLALKNAPDESSKIRYSEKMAVLASRKSHS